MARKFARHQQKGTSSRCDINVISTSVAVGPAPVRGLFFVPFFGSNQKVVSTVKNQAGVIMSCQVRLVGFPSR